MSKLQNYQLCSTVPTQNGLKLIKFCYFMMVLLLLSCGETKTKNTSETTPIENNLEETIAAKNTSKTILCFGDSITAGYGLEDINEAYTGVLQQRIDSLNLNYAIINSGVSGETSAGGKSRIDWVIKQKPDIFILELGANDGLRGIALTETQSNLQAIIDVVKQKSPKTTIILAGMQLPPNMGEDYTTQFKNLFNELAQQNKIAVIPFILKDVGGVAALNQRDGIHPNVEGHKIVANNVWEVLEALIKE